MSDLEFNKQKVEKKAKLVEERISRNVESTNRSVIRALARGEAAREIYVKPGEHSEELVLATLVKKFYTGAKFQPAWKESLAKHDAVLCAHMEAHMGNPAPRKRKEEAPESTEQAPTVT